jgi:amino acid permease
MHPFQVNGLSPTPVHAMVCATAGPIAGVIMFVLSMLLTQFSIVNLVEVKAVLEARRSGHGSTDRTPLLDEDSTISINTPSSGKSKPVKQLDFTECMSETFGWIGEWAAIFAIFVATYGSCVAYLLFIRDNMSKFFPQVFAEKDTWVWVSCIPLCGLAWPDSVGFLAPFSLLGLAAAFAFAVVVVYNATDQMTSHEFMERLDNAPVFKPTTFPLALSIAAFCNEGIVVLTPSTQSAMIRPETYNWTAFWGICYFIVCYMAVGCVHFCHDQLTSHSFCFCATDIASRCTVIIDRLLRRLPFCFA